jgi:predicted  nucleic acid-binding Zn-ribbon protein
MTDEFGNKQREFEKLRKSFEDLMVELTQTHGAVKAKDSELAAARQTIAEKTAAMDRQLD